MKFLVILALIYLIWRLAKHKVTQKIRRARGEEVEPEGIRPITIISGSIIVVYGGYLLWFLITQGYQAFHP